MLGAEYVVEIAIYRKWSWEEWKVQPKIEAQVEASVSMYHQYWDYDMVEVRSTNKVRNWDRELNCFFPVPEANSFRPMDQVKEEWKGGLEGFLHAAKYIKEMLQRAAAI
jgi:hypothetical protein